MYDFFCFSKVGSLLTKLYQKAHLGQKQKSAVLSTVIHTTIIYDYVIVSLSNASASLIELAAIWATSLGCFHPIAHQTALLDYTVLKSFPSLSMDA